MFFNTTLRVTFAIYHLFYSLLLSIVVFGIIYLVWYPQPLYQASGVVLITLLLVTTNIIVPPFLTLIVYKADKKEMMRDIFIIVLIQMSALGYGLYIIEGGRPAYLVFAIDDFDVVRLSDIDWAHQTTQLKAPITSTLDLFEHPKFIYSPFSDDEKIKGLQQTEELIKGISITYRVDSYQNIVTAARVIKATAQPLSALNDYNDNERVADVLRHYPQADGWLPLKATVLDMVVLIDSDGSVIKVVNLRPWHES